MESRTKQTQLVQKTKKVFACCSESYYFCIMNNALATLSNIPVSMATLASLFPNIKAGGHKVRTLERSGQLLRIKKGLYVVSPKVTQVPLSPELIANHVYAPSYVSMHSALRFYGLIPEAVYSVQSMTLKHTRRFDTPLGRFDYTCMSRNAFPVGVTIINKQTYTFLMATPEKALCDLIANSPQVNLRYLKDVERFLSEDLRMDMDDFRNMDVTVFERYAEVGKKATSIQSIIKYLRR